MVHIYDITWIIFYRLYTGRKDSVYSDILSSKAYEGIMRNNVDPELSFNSWKISIEKTLKKSKSAILSDSEFLKWSRLGCMVSLVSKILEAIMYISNLLDCNSLSV